MSADLKAHVGAVLNHSPAKEWLARASLSIPNTDAGGTKNA